MYCTRTRTVRCTCTFECTFESTFVRNNKVVVQSTKVGPTLKVQRYCILRKYEGTFEVLSYVTFVLSYFRILLALQTVCTFITCTVQQ